MSRDSTMAATLPDPQSDRDAYLTALVARFGSDAKVSEVALTLNAVRSALQQSQRAKEGLL